MTSQPNTERDVVERSKLMCERLRAKVHRGQFAMGGGTIGADGSATSWGGEKIMEWANQDGPQAAAVIEELLAALTATQEPLRRALESINEINPRYCNKCGSSDIADAIRIADDTLAALNPGAER